MKHKSTYGHPWAISPEATGQSFSRTGHFWPIFYEKLLQEAPDLNTHILPCIFPFPIFLFLFLFVFIAGCASSDFSRGSASEVDKAYLSADYAWNHSDGSLTDSYQNSSQTAKGAAVGAAAGLGASSLSSGINIVPGVAVGAIVGSALGSYIDAHTTLADKLQNRGVNVIVLGDQVMLVLPSVLMFNEMTSNIRPHAYSTLDLVAQYVSQFPNMAVHVGAYTSASGSPRQVNLALSQQQANAILKYLWIKGINTRLLSAVGYGGTKLVTANTPDWAGDNYRVEITLEKLPV
ncbi:MAG: yiaD 2 [Gammaproteobacteria bacterium]|jgi:outer membrane protein OmpA-like peptidoglycan-associated protein|nr:yiaD 2 [Gammaproteobacteria bacterium]